MLCKHERFKILGDELLRYCTCLDCGKQILLKDALNSLIERLYKCVIMAEKEFKECK